MKITEELWEAHKRRMMAITELKLANIQFNVLLAGEEYTDDIDDAAVGETLDAFQHALENVVPNPACSICSAEKSSSHGLTKEAKEAKGTEEVPGL